MINPTLIHMPSIKPIDKNLLIKNAKKHKVIITFEDHNIIGGLGSAVSETLSENEPIKIIWMGINDKIGRSGEAYELLKKYNVDEQALVKKVLKFFNY